VNVLDCGDAGRDHLECGVKGVEVEIEIAGDQACREPQLERHVRRAELDWRQADVVVTVHEAGKQRLLAVADDWRIWVGAPQFIERADRSDDTVALQHGAVVDLLPPMTVERPRDNMLAANDRGWHFLAPCSKSVVSPLRPRVLPVVRFAGLRIVIAVVKRLHMWKHRFRERAALHFLAG
jgi:hypothetical protein